MKFLVTEVKFDFDEGDIDDPITFEEQVQIIHDNLVDNVCNATETNLSNTVRGV